jgi:hypothetical protein
MKTRLNIKMPGRGVLSATPGYKSGDILLEYAAKMSAFSQRFDFVQMIQTAVKE